LGNASTLASNLIADSIATTTVGLAVLVCAREAILLCAFASLTTGTMPWGITHAHASLLFAGATALARSAFTT
jgi:hypothetical protein